MESQKFERKARIGNKESRTTFHKYSPSIEYNNLSYSHYSILIIILANSPLANLLPLYDHPHCTSASCPESPSNSLTCFPLPDIFLAESTYTTMARL